MPPQPVSWVAYGIHLDNVRRANIFPTCRYEKACRGLFPPAEITGGRVRKTNPAQEEVMEAQLDEERNVLEDLVGKVLEYKQGGSTHNLRRQVHDPALHAYLMKMSPKKKQLWSRRVQQVVMAKARALQERFVAKQSELDDARVFHPAANAQRMHTQLLTMLHRKVDILAVEDAVLRFMLEASEAKTRGESRGFSSWDATLAKLSHLGDIAGGGRVSKRNKSTSAAAAAAAGASDSRKRRSASGKTPKAKTPQAAEHAGDPAAERMAAFCQANEELAQEAGQAQEGCTAGFLMGPEEFQEVRTKKGLGRGELDHEHVVLGELESSCQVFHHFQRGRKGRGSKEAAKPKSGRDDHGNDALETMKGLTQKQRTAVKYSVSQIGQGVLNGAHVELGVGSNAAALPRSGQGFENIFAKTMGDYSGEGEARQEEGDEDEEEQLLSSTVADGEGGAGADQGNEPDQVDMTAVTDESVVVEGSKDVSGGHSSSSSSSHAAAELEMRIQVVWEVLQVPAKQKLELLAKYCNAEWALCLPEAVTLMEEAGAAIVFRESLAALVERVAINGELMTLETAKEAYRESQRLALDLWIAEPRQQEVTIEDGADELAALSVETQLVRAWLEGSLAALTSRCQALCSKALEEYHDVITYKGVPWKA